MKNCIDISNVEEYHDHLIIIVTIEKSSLFVEWRRDYDIISLAQVY